jgi:hypothetical protein
MPNDDTDAIVGSAEEHTSVPTSGEDSVLSGVSRRTFLKAAALGTAAAAVLNTTNGGGFSFGPLSAFANDLSGFPCTANDVNILGPATVLNEPCICAPGSTFNANVQFTVVNNAGAGRYCISLHLVATTLPDGTVVQGQDVVLYATNGLSTAPGKSTTLMTGTILNFPCNTGGALVCFGGPNEPSSGKCAPGTCSTIAWTTSTGGANCKTADTSPPGGQCRHQQVCVQGFGASLVCKSGTSCNVICGGTAVLTAAVSGGISPYTYTLVGTDGSSQTYPISGMTTDTSHDFTISPLKNTTYTLTVTDSTGCTRTATFSVIASALAQPTITAGTPDCAGNTTFTAAPGLADYCWSVDGATCKDTGATNTFTIKLSPGSHLVTVTVANSAGCKASNTASVTVNTPVAVSASAGTPNCSGQVTLTASASGGAGGYTFQWFDGTNPIGTGSPLTVTLAPGDNSITVTVTDSAGCSATSAPITVHINTPPSATLALSGDSTCGNGVLSFTATGHDGSLSYATYTFYEDAVQVQKTSSNTLAYGPNLDLTCHSFQVSVTDGAGCTSPLSAPIHVSQCVNTVVGC